VLRPDPSLMATPPSRHGIGCQSVFSLPSPTSVRLLCMVPSLFITKSCQSLFLWLLDAIFLPFGDQAGSSSIAGSLVSWVMPVPPGFIVKISRSPSRRLEKTILPLAPGKGASAGLVTARTSRLVARAVSAITNPKTRALVLPSHMTLLAALLNMPRICSVLGQGAEQTLRLGYVCSLYPSESQRIPQMSDLYLGYLD
jgi:hypothetical protein